MTPHRTPGNTIRKAKGEFSDTSAEKKSKKKAALVERVVQETQGEERAQFLLQSEGKTAELGAGGIHLCGGGGQFIGKSFVGKKGPDHSDHLAKVTQRETTTSPFAQHTGQEGRRGRNFFI